VFIDKAEDGHHTKSAHLVRPEGIEPSATYAAALGRAWLRRFHSPATPKAQGSLTLPEALVAPRPEFHRCERIPSRVPDRVVAIPRHVKGRLFLLKEAQVPAFVAGVRVHPRLAPRYVLRVVYGLVILLGRLDDACSGVTVRARRDLTDLMRLDGKHGKLVSLSMGVDPFSGNRVLERASEIMRPVLSRTMSLLLSSH
jgi:hypothetical protein